MNDFHLLPAASFSIFLLCCQTMSALYFNVELLPECWTCDYKLCHVKRMMMCYWTHLWPLVSQKALQIRSSESRLRNAYRCYWADRWSKYCKAKTVLKSFIKPTANAVLHQSAGTIFHLCIVLLLYKACSLNYMKFCDVAKY